MDENTAESAEKRDVIDQTRYFILAETEAGWGVWDRTRSWEKPVIVFPPGDEGLVVVVGDAVASPSVAHDEGIERMRAAGVELVGTKSLFYEWVRTVDRAAVVDEAMAGVPLPDGLML